MQNPLVSVLIMSYNQEEYIQQAIEGCLMQQTRFAYEIIIHDDASTDKTAHIIQRYADQYPEVIVPIIQRENQYSKGVRITATFLIPRAKGKYIAFCEGDDYWTDPLKLEKQISIMEADPSISFCFTATKWVFVNENNKSKIRRYYRANHFLSPKDILVTTGRVADTVSTVLKKEVYNEIPDWYLTSPVGDTPLALMSMLIGRLFYLNDVTVAYRRGVSNSWTTVNSSNSVNYENSLNKIIKTFDEFDEDTEFKYHYFVKKRIHLEILEYLICYADKDVDKELFFPRFSLWEKMEYYIFRTLNSRSLWYRYRKLLRALGC